jgi:hypothetical protein
MLHYTRLKRLDTDKPQLIGPISELQRRCSFVNTAPALEFIIQLYDGIVIFPILIICHALTLAL